MILISYKINFIIHINEVVHSIIIIIFKMEVKSEIAWV